VKGDERADGFRILRFTSNLYPPSPD
jgi:hypothetical protein